MSCENELADLQNAILARGATALALLGANSAKFAADAAKAVADMNYTTALANDAAAALLVAAKQAAYDACVNGMPAPGPLQMMPTKKKASA